MRFFCLSLVLMMAGASHGVRADDEIFNLIQEGKCETLLSNDEMIDSLKNHNVDTTADATTRMIYEGVCFEQDKEKAIELYEQQLATGSLNAEAFFILSQHYLESDDPKKQELGEKYLQISALRAIRLADAYQVLAKSVPSVEKDFLSRFNVNGIENSLGLYHPYLGPLNLPEKFLRYVQYFDDYLLNKTPEELFLTAERLLKVKYATDFERALAYYILFDLGGTFNDDDLSMRLYSALIDLTLQKGFESFVLNYKLLRPFDLVLHYHDLVSFYQNVDFDEPILIRLVEEGMRHEASVTGVLRSPYRVFFYLNIKRKLNLPLDKSFFNKTLNEMLRDQKQMATRLFDPEELKPI